jgi:hypothetical protein
MMSAQGFVAASFKVSRPMGPNPNWAILIFRFIVREVFGVSGRRGQQQIGAIIRGWH